MATKRPSEPTDPGDDALGRLITRLGPLNNSCRAADGIEKAELLWDMGDAALAAFPDADDAVLWGVTRRSYMTRDILRYALIIRRGWGERSALRRTFPRLAHYTLFREALPFLKGDRSGVDEEVYQDVVRRLNGGPLAETKAHLQALKAKAIGRKHRKGQARARMANPADAVREAVRVAYDAAAGVESAATLRGQLGADRMLRYARWCIAAAEDSEFEAEEDEGGLPEPFAGFTQALARVGRASREDRAGFRKAVGAATLMDAADVLNALRSDEQLDQWKARRGKTIRT